MDNYIMEAHVASIKKAVEEGELPLTKTVGIEMLDMENFKFKLKNKNGIVSIGEMIALKEFIDSAIANISQITHTILLYDKKSPLYWGKVDEMQDEEEVEDCYVVCIDLEVFMYDDSQAREVAPGHVIPDNYVLAEKVLKEFEEAGNNIKGIEDVSFRELSKWHMKSKKQSQKLVKFIDDKYVIPELKRLMEIGNIKKMNYADKKFEFVLNKRRKTPKG